MMTSEMKNIYLIFKREAKDVTIPKFLEMYEECKGDNSTADTVLRRMHFRHLGIKTQTGNKARYKRKKGDQSI